MKNYLDIVSKVVIDGKLKGNRTGIDTVALPFVHFEHDMAEGFPLLTTKKMGMKNIATELEGFLRGVTSKRWYQDRGCHIWDEWANPVKVVNNWNEHCVHVGDHSPMTHEDRKYQQKIEDDLGPLGYSWQWRRFNEVYDEDDNGQLQGFDQIKSIVQTLETNPLDRRMVCSAWNPNQMNKMALPPCHTMFNVVVIGDELHLGWMQRSVDSGYGLPYNIASYGLLLTLLAKHAGLKPGLLSGTLADCHIYINQIDALKEQLTRTPYDLPQLEITVDKPFEIINDKLVINWTANDIRLINYKSWPKLSLGEIAV